MSNEFSHINPDLIQYENMKTNLHILLNAVESLQSEILDLKNIIEEQKDEINKLKGEQAKPKFKPKN